VGGEPCVALAGAVAQHTSAATAMTVMAAASVAVTLVLAPGLRPDRGSPMRVRSQAARPVTSTRDQELLT
jgi:hypothetical protein